MPQAPKSNNNYVAAPRQLFFSSNKPMKATAKAPANIALIKYWGKTDEILRLPQNSSISMNLDGLFTTTTVDFDEKYISDEIIFNGEAKSKQAGRIIKHLDLIRKIAKTGLRAKVATSNNFPAASGIASSASGFAALTVAACGALGMNLNEKELSIIARQGSGSACRSIPDGFVEWHKGDTSETSFAESLHPADYWDIIDIVAIISDEEKAVSSTAGQTLASASRFFAPRLENIENKIRVIKKNLANRDFRRFGEIIEAEALELQAIMMTSSPALIYWQPKTLEIIKGIHKLREQGLEAYFTEDAGPNLHIFVENKNRSALIDKLKGFEGIKRIIACKPGSGTKQVDTHLF